MRSQCCSTKRTWFNECRHPSLKVGTLDFPLFILPILASLLFLLSKRYGLLSPSTLSQPNTSIPLNEKEKEQVPDTENQIPPSSHPAPQRWHKWIRNIVWFYRMGWTWQQGILLDAYDRRTTAYSPRATAILEVLSLLLTAYVSEQRVRRACLFTALGWAVWGAQNWNGDDVGAYGSIGYVLAALPTAWLLGWEDKALASLSGFSLATLAIHAQIPADSLLRHMVLIDRCVWPLGLMAAIALVQTLLRAVQRGLRSDSTVGTELQRLFCAIFEVGRADVGDFGHTLVSAVITPLLAIAVSGLAAGFLSSCLSWNWAILSKPATPPSFGPALWITFYVNLYAFGIACWVKTRKSPHWVPLELRPLEEAVAQTRILLFDAAGYTTLLSTSIWMALMANTGNAC